MKKRIVPRKEKKGPVTDTVNKEQEFDANKLELSRVVQLQNMQMYQVLDDQKVDSNFEEWFKDFHELEKL